MIRPARIASATGALLLSWNAFAAGDGWLTNTHAFPIPSQAALVRSNHFLPLGAEPILGRLKVRWTPPAPLPDAAVTLRYSVDFPGHWPARDWRTLEMSLRGGGWEAGVPVEDVDVPVAYFLTAVEGGVTNLSPMRLCGPRAAGMQEPGRVFWPFLDGVEEGAEAWRRLDGGTLTATAPGKNGKASLGVSLAEGGRAVAVATPRVRGWQIERRQARGVRVWLRTREGAGEARLSLLAHAHSTNQVVCTATNVFALGPQWRKVELPFDAFPALPRLEVDSLVVEFRADGPREFLLDDLSLLGGWRLEVE